MTIRRLLLLAALLCTPALAPLPALAQQAIVVTACGGLTFDAGPLRPLTQDTTGTLCTAGGPGGTTSTVTQSSTTSGQSGTLVQGAVTTSAPTYTTAKTNPLSLTTGGALRTQDLTSVTQGSTTSGQSGQLIQGAVTTASPSYTTAQTAPLSLDVAGNLRTGLVFAGTSASVGGTAANADGASGAITGLNVFSFNGIFNGSTWDLRRSIINATNSTGAGIAAAGILAQVDDTSPTAITENQFGNLRMGSNRTLLVNQLGVYPYSAINAAVAVPLTAHSGNVAAATAAATLTGTATTTVYITGFTCTPGGATAAALVSITVTGPLGGTMTYTAGAPAGATIMGTPINVNFSPAVPASAVNTTIVVSMPSLGSGNTNASCNATGFYM